MSEAAVLERISARREASLEEIRAAIRQPSVSRTGEGLAAMAAMVEAALRDVGARTWQSSGPVAPIVEGVLDAAPGKPTLLVYDLYDVQPAAGQPGWSVPPFAAVLEPDAAGRERLVARGAFNSKGALLDHLSRCCALSARRGSRCPATCVS